MAVYAVDVEEIWKDIAGYEGYYQISNLGRVRSLSRTVTHLRGEGNRRGMKRRVPERTVAHDVNWAGYHRVNLRKHGENTRFAVHRLVAEAFIPNPHSYPQINHKDENPHNNHANNLEWCTNSYNINYGTRSERAASHLRKPVVQCDMQGREIKTFASQCEASRKTGIGQSCIWRACAGLCKQSGGFVWKYAEL